MASDFIVHALGSPIGVTFDTNVPDSERRAVLAAWAGLLSDSAEPETVVHADKAGDELGDRLATQVTLAGIEALRGRALMFHACGVALPDGHVIGFVGPSGRGKTTLARALASDYGYVTDETLAVLPGGEVLPYAKPLSIGQRPKWKRTVSPAELGLLPLPAAPLRLAALVLLDRRPDAGPAHVDPVPLGTAIGELAPEISSLGGLPQPLATLSDALRSTGGARRLVYADAADLDGIIEEVLEAARADDAETKQLDPVGGRTPGPGRYSRCAATDALAVDDDILVLGDAHLTLLTGLGPLVWRLADDIDGEALVGKIEALLPPPPPGIRAAEAVDAALVDLVQAGLLIRGD